MVQNWKLLICDCFNLAVHVHVFTNIHSDIANCTWQSYNWPWDVELLLMRTASWAAIIEAHFSSHIYTWPVCCIRKSCISGLHLLRYDILSGQMISPSGLYWFVYIPRTPGGGINQIWVVDYQMWVVDYQMWVVD